MKLISNIFDLFFPKLCLTCKNPLHQDETLLCHHCLSDLPFTAFPFNKDNPVYERLIPIVKIEKATSVLFFNKSGIVQELIHQLKYNNHPEIGELVVDFMQVYPDLYTGLSQVDYIIPVPLHSKKFKKRGYNQLTRFATKLAEVYKVQTSGQILLRQKNTETQTHKNKEQRRKNVANAFVVKNPESYTGKHFLIIDDVMTSGATIEACAQTIIDEIPGAKVSVLTMSVVI